ncbi:hypothetical protein ACMGE5_00415 [Macrococcus equi]|uniref:SF0329 family protein n=1 Tax=Macrococcus equi TaxID=3395462 RepID=UPI0039BE6D81
MIKRWSKEKLLLESFICEHLQGRLQWHQAVHRYSHDQPARLSLTLDKEEIFATNTIKVEILRYEHLKLSKDAKSIFETKMQQRKGFEQLMEHYYQDISFLYAESKGFYGFTAFEVIREYPNLSIEEALNSPFELVRAYAMFDRRLGRRRLQNLDLKDEHPLVKKFYKIRISHNKKD